MSQQSSRCALTNLPPELLEHIVGSLPTAQSIARLSRSSKRLHTFVEQDGWQIFARNRFPSTLPSLSDLPLNKDVVRTLVTLSQAWDRRAFIAQVAEPKVDVRAYPGARRIEQWRRPRGQTIGFAPQIDCYEEIGPTWHDRSEVMAFSAGAEICLRNRDRTSGRAGVVKLQWRTFRPRTALEGRDDVTCLHLLPASLNRIEDDYQRVIAGTANGELRLLKLPRAHQQDVAEERFITNDMPVRSSSLLQQQSDKDLLAVVLGDSRVSLYNVDEQEFSAEATSSLDIPRPSEPRSKQRIWSTRFLSPTLLAVGQGPCEHPILIYEIPPDGAICTAEPRRISLNHDETTSVENLSDPTQTAQIKAPVYPIIPLSPGTTSSGGSQAGQIFVSGAKDGIIRLHDLRTPTSVCRSYVDPTDDSAIYSLLARGRETLVAGVSRYSLVKFFDLRIGAKAYSYANASCDSTPDAGSGKRELTDWSLFLKENSATYSGRGGGNNWIRRSAESGVYSLSSPSPHSPFIYAGVENAAVELAFTAVSDGERVDPAFFRPFKEYFPPLRGADDRDAVAKRVSRDYLCLAMHDLTPDFKLFTQQPLWRCLYPWKDGKGRSALESEVPGLDWRWRSDAGVRW